MKEFQIRGEGKLCGDCLHLKVTREWFTVFLCVVWNKSLIGKENFSVNSQVVNRCKECLKAEKKAIVRV